MAQEKKVCTCPAVLGKLFPISAWKRSMDTVAAKVQLMGTTITDMAGWIDAYVNKMDGMMITIGNNDINVKEFDTKMGEMLATMNQAVADAAGIQHAQLQALRAEVGNNIVGTDGNLQTASDLVTGVETAYIGTEQVQEYHKNKISAVEQEVIRISTEAADFKKQVVSEATMLKVETEMEQGDSACSGKEKETILQASNIIQSNH